MNKTNLKPLVDVIKKQLDNEMYYNAKEGLRKLLIIYKTERE